MTTIDMTMPNGKKSGISVGVNAGKSVEIRFMREGIVNVAVALPPSIGLRLASALTDAALSTQAVPTEAQKREQGRHCGCGGSDDMCPCQNVVPIR